MFTIDGKYEDKQIQQFASQVVYLSEAEKKLFGENFSNTQSDDFNAGLLAGFANAYTVLSSDMSPQSKANIIGHLLAFVADKIAKRG